MVISAPLKGPPVRIILVAILIIIVIIGIVIWSMSGSGSQVESPEVSSGVPTGPPVDCAVSEWVNVGECDKFCGPGQQQQTRTIVTTPENGGAACPTELSRSVPCKLRECNNVDCAVSDWSPYDASVCTSTSKTKTHTRTVTAAKVDYGADCPKLTEIEKCTSTEVDATCNFTTASTPNLSGCSIDSSGAVSGTKSTSYTSAVSGCSKPAVSSTCTSADTARCNYVLETDKSECELKGNRVKGKKTMKWTSTVTGCPEIQVNGSMDCTSEDVTASPAPAPAPVASPRETARNKRFKL